MIELTTEAFRFMAELQKNNNRDWFELQRERYQETLFQPIKDLAILLNDPVAFLLPQYKGKAKVSRIYNDLRFHKDKPPYKKHMWISFGTDPADIFVAVGEEGWAAGVGISSSRKQDMESWRNNLLRYPDQWRKMTTALGVGSTVELFFGDSYKKALYDNIPEDILPVVQSKSLWIVDAPRPEFEQDAAKDFFKGIQRFLPVYYFMTESDALEERLDELGHSLEPVDEEVQKIWEAAQV